MEGLLASLNFGMVLLYGVLLSVNFAGGCTIKKERRLMMSVTILILCVQTISGALFGVDFTAKLYPFITHFPLVILLVIGLKKEVGIAVVSVLIAYFCCQLPRWVGAIALYLFHLRIVYLLVYTLAIIIFYFLIRKYFVKPIYGAMTYSRNALLLLGCLPFFYYVFDYATTIYTDMLYRGVKMVSESLPAAMALFYVLFIVMYHNEVQRRNRIEIDNTMLSKQLEQAAKDIQSIVASEKMARIYRHDLRHHLSLLCGLADGGDIAGVKAYLLQMQKGIDHITPIYFTENKIVNLVLVAFDRVAKQKGVTLCAQVKLPEKVGIPDTELCSVLSNGLENAITAVSKIEDVSLRTVRVNSSINRDKILIMIQNAYMGEIEQEGGIPSSKISGHGFGCRSIVAIAEKRRGFATFETKGNLFTLRVVLPME